jgi:cytochrome c-type biogenesis protein CcmH/NrfG
MLAQCLKFSYVFLGGEQDQDLLESLASRSRKRDNSEMFSKGKLHCAYGTFLAAMVLLAGSLTLFHKSWNHPFVLDDVAKVEMNPDLRAPGLNLASFFQGYSQVDTHSRNDPSRPLTFFLYWLCWQLGDGSPVPFHILSGLLHGLCAFFVGLLTFRLGRERLNAKSRSFMAVSASLLFLTLPLNAGTAIYVYGLSDVLSALLALVIIFAAGEERPLTRTALSISAVLFILALGAKQSSVAIPALVFVVQPAQRRLALMLLGMATLYVLARFILFGRIGDLEAHEVYPLWQYLGSQGVLYFKYIRLALWPMGLCLDHAIFPRHFDLWQTLLGWVLIAFLSVISLWLTFHRTGEVWWLGLGWLVFFLGLVPTSSIFPTTDLFVERRAYLSTAGLALAAVGMLFYVHRRWPPLGWTLSMVIVTANGYLSWTRNDVFSKAENVWLEVLSLYPRDTRARLNLATTYLESRRWLEAKEILEQLVKEEPRNFQAWANLGTIYHSDLSPFQDAERAWSCYQRVLALEPTDLITLSNAGFLMVMTKRPDQAIALFSAALQISPKSPQYHFGLGRALELKADRAGAIREFERALYWDPHFKPAQAVLRQYASEPN